MDEKRFDRVHQESSGILNPDTVTVYRDRVTGVNYLLIQSLQGGGLTPLLNPDGTPIVTP